MGVDGKRILILGDSLSVGEHSPGQVLARELRDAGALVTVDARSGRSPFNMFRSELAGSSLAAWLSQRSLEAIDVSIVFLGTNSIGIADDHEYEQLRDGLPGDVWAIGPPTMVDRSTDAGAVFVTARMRRMFSGPMGRGGQFIDARPLTPLSGRASDGVHFRGAGAQVLGKRLAVEFTASAMSVIAVVLVAAGVVWLLLH